MNDIKLVQWLDTNRKKRKLLITEKVKEANRLVRRYNQDGTPVEWLTVTKIEELAKQIVLIKLAESGEVQKFELLSDEVCTVVVEQLLYAVPDQERFVPETSISRSTATEVLRIMNIIRSGAKREIPGEVDDRMTRRYEQLQKLIDTYESELTKRQVYDKNRVIREATEIMAQDPTRHLVWKDMEIAVLMPMELTYLEKTFLDCIGYTEVSYLISDADAGRSYRFFSGYGAVNEIGYITQDIVEKKRPFGQVTVLYTQPGQEAFLCSVFDQNEIPYHMVSGCSALSSKFVYTMREILLWIKDGEKTVLAPTLKKSGCLHYETFGETESDNAESDKPESDNMESDKTEYVSVENRMERELRLAVPMEEGEPKPEVDIADFFARLVKLQKEYKPKKSLQWAVTKPLYDELFATFAQMDLVEGYEKAAEIILRDLEALRVSEAEAQDAVLIMKAGSRYVLDRPYNYVIGLSADDFQTTVVDSPVLSDAGISTFVNDTKGSVDYAKQSEDKKQEYLVQTFGSLPEGELILGYSTYDTVGMCDCSPSVFFIQMLEQYGGENALVPLYRAMYDLLPYRLVDNNAISVSAEEIEELTAYRKKQEVMTEGGEETEEIDYGGEVETADNDYEGEEENADVEDAALDYDAEEFDILEKISLSPTAIQSMLHCPLQYYYHYVRHIPPEDDQNQDASRWLTASDKGTFVHAIFQKYCDLVFVNQQNISSKLEQAKFDAVFENELAKMVEKQSYYSEAVYQTEKDEIYNATRNYLEHMHSEFSREGYPWKVECCEHKINTGRIYEITNDDETCAVWITITGIIDRLDSYTSPDGIKHYRMVDYKSGKAKYMKAKIDNHEWVQHTMYANAMRTDDKIQIDSFVYEFPFDETTPSLSITGPGLSGLDECAENTILNTIVGQYYRSDGRVSDKGDCAEGKLCEYCDYVDICRERIGNQL